MSKAYLYGMILMTNSFLMENDYPEADTYGEIKEIGEDEYILSGRLEIEKANEDFGLHLPENDEYQTIGGLILHEYQSFPKVHEIITIAHFKFKIIKVTATKIELVKLKVEK